MKPRFTSREAIFLYIIVCALFVGFYLLGLSLGRAPLPAESRVEAVGGEERGLVREARDTRPPTRPVESFVETSAPPPQATSAEEREALEEVIVDEPPILEAAEPPPVSAPAATIEPAVPSEAGLFTIQVAALSTLREAQQALIRLEANNFDARIQPPTAALGDRFYRVWVGQFQSIEEARDLEGRLKAAGFLTYVRKLE
jgi:cell division septation protein DedD